MARPLLTRGCRDGHNARMTTEERIMAWIALVAAVAAVAVAADLVVTAPEPGVLGVAQAWLFK